MTEQQIDSKAAFQFGRAITEHTNSEFYLSPHTRLTWCERRHANCARLLCVLLLTHAHDKQNSDPLLFCVLLCGCRRKAFGAISPDQDELWQTSSQNASGEL